MKSSNSQTRKYFPFSPGLPWKVQYGLFIKPSLEQELVKKFISINPIKVVCHHNDIFENFFSLSILEAYNQNYNNDLFWIGQNKYYDLIKLNGLAKPSTSISKNELKNYPTPLFKDLEQNVYCNCLLNYRELKTYYHFPIKHRKENICSQIFENSLFSWNKKYIPIIRNLNLEASKYKEVSIFADSTEYSSKPIDCLQLSVNQIKSLVTVLSQEGYICNILSNDQNNFYPFKTIPLNIYNIFNFIAKSSYILSKQIDYLLISLFLSKAKILYTFPFSKINIREYFLDKNYFFIHNKYSSFNEITCLKNPDVMQYVAHILD